MGIKKLTRCWRKGKKVFPSVAGVKDEYAFNLLIMGDIKVSKKMWRRLGITPSFPKTPRDLSLIIAWPPRKAANVLYDMGWSWEKYKGD